LGGHQGQTSFQEGNLATLLVGDGQDIFQPGISVAEFVSTALLRLDTLPSGGFLPGVGEMFSEGDTHHWIFFVRDRATAATTTRGTGGGGGRVISHGASVCKTVTAARGGGSRRRVGTTGMGAVWTCVGTRNIWGEGIIDMGRRGRWGRCRELEVTMRRRGVIHGASEVTLRRHHLKRSLILQHVRLRHGRGACRRKERWVVNEKLEAKERNKTARMNGGQGGWDSTAGNQTHENHLQFDKEAAEGAAGGMGTRGRSCCDHLLMKGRSGRGADCLAAGHRLAWGGAGEDPFEQGYVQWQVEQGVISEYTMRGVVFSRGR